jgi:hypothetical protein
MLQRPIAELRSVPCGRDVRVGDRLSERIAFTKRLDSNQGFLCLIDGVGKRAETLSSFSFEAVMRGRNHPGAMAGYGTAGATDKASFTVKHLRVRNRLRPSFSDATNHGQSIRTQLASNLEEATL